MTRLLWSALLLMMVAVPAGGVPPAPPPGQWPTGSAVDVVRAFDPPPQPWLSGHRGVDLLVAGDHEVRAPLPGVVVLAGRVVDRPVLVIQSGRFRMSFEPVQASVAVGQVVGAGDRVGTVSAEARGHCPPRMCLHWGLRIDGVYHDPLLLVRRYRPVLLPDG